jgi:crossover junction endodeoxyribonuclease RusA
VNPFEFIIKSRPLSIQAKKCSLERWKKLVKQEAENKWMPSRQQADSPVCVTLICLLDEASVDIDNIIKPILDALKGLAYLDDSIITDVIARRRKLTGNFDLSHVSPVLLGGFAHGGEFTYVHISDAPPEGTLI